MSLLISTHALPPFSYRVPDHLSEEVRTGSAVVVPLSGYSRLGIVVETDEDADLATEEVRSLARDFSLRSEIVELCRWVSENAAIPLAAALRAALPPGVKTGHYRVVTPYPEWPWTRGSLVSGTLLRRKLGGEGVRRAESRRRVIFAPEFPSTRNVEWVSAERANPPPERAYRQWALFEEIQKHDSGLPVHELLDRTGANRATLRRLVERGAVRLGERAEPLSIHEAHGTSVRNGDFARDVRKAARRGGAWLWRLPDSEQSSAVAALIEECTRDGEQALILAPEISAAERMSSDLLSLLPDGCTVAAYHSGLGVGRAGIHLAAGRGEVDVVVGTRAAALLPLSRPGLVCVIDEPNEAHRAEPGFEGIPIHVRDVALERGRLQDILTVFISSVPSLRLYARKPELGELTPKKKRRGPAIRVVDMRGSGASLSSTLLEFCRESVEAGLRAAVILGRLGYAPVVSCARCGDVRTCKVCDLPLAFHKKLKSLVCNRCGRREKATKRCESCGAERLVPTGLAIERARVDIFTATGREVGLLTAEDREFEDSPVVVGTARRIFEEDWDALVLPDIDMLLFGSGVGAVEGAYRLLHRAVESARERLLVQTRAPEHYALRAALRQDYPSFAALELGRRKSLGYPPYSHLAKLTLAGPWDDVLRAVESRLRPSLTPDVEASDLFPSPEDPAGWQVVLRARESASLTRAGAEAARTLARGRKSKNIRVRVEIEPEEV